MKGSRHLFFQLLICIIAAGITFYARINKHNELTELRLMVPQVAKEVKQIQKANIALKYEVDRFESPIHLMELLRKPEFSHLKYPYLSDLIILPSNPQKEVESRVSES